VVSHRRTPLALLIAVAVAIALAPSAPAQADPREDKKRIDAEVAKASAILESATERARAAAQRLAAVTAQLPAAQSRVAEARGQVAAAEATANTARRKAAEAQEALNRARQRYQESERRVQQARDRVATFASANYKGSSIVTLNMLLDARTPQEIIERFGYFERVMATERAAMDDLLAARMAAKRAENEAGLKQRAAAEAEAAAERALEEAKRVQADAEAAVAEVQRLVAERESALKVAEQERAASLARYQRAREEAARIAARLAAWEAQQRRNQNAQTPSLRPGARLLMPTRGWKSSDFGMRFDPYYKVWQRHDGIDIAAPGGTPIYAAAAGTVIFAGWNGGYGNFTCISHGQYNGQWLSTCYAHQSAINVQVGQQVRAGQVIGRVGTTGASTGYHLHFEVRLNGTPVQPLNWLPACLC
jgi:murein DD-endopeptidase MepM/ murein hydrolase activator NlpD